jgi:hypothetical protein
MSLFMQKYPLMEGEGGGEGGDGGGGGGGDGGKGGDKGPDHSETLLRGLAVVAQGMTKLQESNESLLTLLKEQAERGGKGDDGEDGGGRKGGNGSTGLFEGVDMEQLDRQQFAALMLSKFEERLSHHLKDTLKPFEEKISQVSTRVEEDMANREVNGIASSKKDFYEWRTEIGQLVKDTPNLSVARAYTIARSENPEKAKKMDEKYAEKKESTTQGFVGLSPTGGGGRGEGAGKLKFNEAAEKAYADVLSELGGVSLDQLPVVGGRH